MNAQSLEGDLIALNPFSLALGKVIGGMALIGLVLWFFGAEQVGTLLLYILFPILMVVAGLALFGGGSAEMWSMSALKEGFKQGVKDARAKPQEPSFEYEH